MIDPPLPEKKWSIYARQSPMALSPMINPVISQHLYMNTVTQLCLAGVNQDVAEGPYSPTTTWDIDLKVLSKEN
jgi:hypothetical protein